MSSDLYDFSASEPEKPAKAIDSGLYIVATPIGNLADLSQRAVEMLRAADLIAVEDSRVTGKLLHHLGLKKRMRPYHDHSSEADREALLAAAREGVVVLVSDAGTPLISDPGYKLVRAAREAGIPVSTAPGASAVVTALSISGLPTDRFLFAGFLPSKAKARADVIAEIGNVKSTLVFYESGPRLGATLAALAEQLGPREAVVARELTKKFEEVVSGTLPELAERYAAAEPKGEIVLIVGPPGEVQAEQGDYEAALMAALENLPPAKAAKDIAKRFGVDRAEVYERAMALKSST
ncbi:16S rRNA (cytidine(1402)-2'-O)-methyltransferase [uncultured Sphingorhabdus sp.]|uniref:16S rRNA (cytidine(1402)-2'-O)-methyltransferase n=1 Tax=uncultured Sphingorhabdus sp. TaxID=1686106 RepID=UPI00262A0AD3|nr:16S rRNA (cytidine(1402)-2'-O)-methyltransferase [uncultured Sphingorhabdus sp.]HMS20278.1 16S rRNA (cytidine(1402)-2'-O)-methyltransferase [Sphingorhabdus sp.]